MDRTLQSILYPGEDSGSDPAAVFMSFKESERERATHSDNSTWRQLSFHWKHWKLFFVALRLTHTSDKSNSLKSWENIFAFKVSEITIKQKQVLCSWTCQMPLVAILDSILVFVLGSVCVCVFCFYWKKNLIIMIWPLVLFQDLEPRCSIKTTRYWKYWQSFKIWYI